MHLILVAVVTAAPAGPPTGPSAGDSETEASGQNEPELAPTQGDAADGPEAPPGATDTGTGTATDDAPPPSADEAPPSEMDPVDTGDAEGADDVEGADDAEGADDVADTDADADEDCLTSGATCPVRVVGPPAMALAPPPTDPQARRSRLPMRHGFMISGGTGMHMCGRNEGWCQEAGVGPGGHAEAGFRRRRLGATLAIAGGGTKVDLPSQLSGLRGAASYLFVGPTGYLFLAARGRFDPYIGLGLGYAQQWLRIDGSGVELVETLRRGGVRPALGASYYLRPRVLLGARIDFTAPFAGEVCVTGGSSEVTVNECQSNADYDIEKPTPWSFSLDLRVMLGRDRAGIEHRE